jgi:ADP-heptose:LPS heptosyltransferase
MFQPFDLALNERWQAARLPGTPLGKYLEVDFTIASITPHLEPRWVEAFNAGSIDFDALREAVRSNNNVVQWNEIVLEAQKPFAPGRSLVGLTSLVARRGAGLGDVVMAIMALGAIKRATGLAVYLETMPAFAPLAALCPLLDGVFSDVEVTQAHLARGGSQHIDWNFATHGLSRLHQVDSYLMSLGLTLPAALKPLEIALAPGFEHALLERLGISAKSARGRVVLHPGMTDPNRTWPKAFWESLARDLRISGREVVIIGRSDGADGRSVLRIDCSDVLDLTNQLSLVETVSLMRHCNVLISGDSGPIQLAGATDIGIIGLYSVVSGANRLPYRASGRAVAIEPACALHPCYPRFNDPDVVSAYMDSHEAGADGGGDILPHWCLNPDTYSCLREDSTLIRVKAAVDDMLEIPSARRRSSRIGPGALLANAQAVVSTDCALTGRDGRGKTHASDHQAPKVAAQRG